MTTKPASKTNYDVPGLSKGIRIIELLCESPQPLGVSEISRGVNLNKHMAFRLLQTLIQAGWVVTEGEGPKYRLSLLPFHHVSKPVHRTDLVGTAAGPMKDLWQEIGESVGLGVLDGDRVMYLLHYNGSRDICINGRVGLRYLLHCSAPGKLLLAHAGDALQNQIVSQGLPAMTPHTIQTVDRLCKELELIRHQGYSLDLEEYVEGGLCFSTPIFNYEGRVLAALNVSTLTYHFNKQRLLSELAPKITATAQQISLALGHATGKLNP